MRRGGAGRAVVVKKATRGIGAGGAKRERDRTFPSPSLSPLPGFLRSPASTRERAPQNSKMAPDWRTEQAFRDETPSNRLQAGYC